MIQSDNPVVEHGIKAVSMVYQLTNRVPDLIKRSHLETAGGQSAIMVQSTWELTSTSLDNLLVTNISHS